MGVPKVATVWFEACSGCHMSFLDLDEDLVSLVAEPQEIFVERGQRARLTATIASAARGDLNHWRFESIDLAPIPGFEGTPMNLLVAIDAGGKYVIIGNQQSVHDYSDIALPRPINECANCHRPVSAEAFIWDLHAGIITGRIYDCPHCGDSGEREAMPADVERSARLLARFITELDDIKLEWKDED